MTTLIFSKGYLYPIRENIKFNQQKEMAEGGPIRVVTWRPPTVTLPLHFERMPLSDYQNLKAWLLSPTINGAANWFTFTDVNAVEYAVRWWEDNNVFSMPEVSAGLYTFDMVLIVDDFAG